MADQHPARVPIVVVQAAVMVARAMLAVLELLKAAQVAAVMQITTEV